ncbi:3-beta hydroxysteroid dehydrogenase [Aliidongia dinghuensis]|uniref:3-beta hydroxysteroid dehydrogenase n=1 Tax=Aliidongia dinghuensis TaxID=1867774 RepID=A0A8J2YZL1_9PROT|nr:NAD(P)-dependent oxidoreductase [Aliidongia dinghuensis]GGF38114.1 3-beta hydroxysteroid dehydrogenase [Aliidongia dinghuensis]
MKLAIIGATGNVGTRLVAEALGRGHQVTAIARDPAKLRAQDRLTPVVGDASQPTALAPRLAGHDAVVSTVGFRASDPALLIDAVRRSGVKRYLVVGGAGSLEVAPGKLLIEMPDFPAFVLEEATRGKLFLDALRRVDDLDWTMLSPSALFTAGERTGHFRLGGDQLLVGADGKSWISYEDYAVALLDEIEKPRHVRARFTVGY